MRFFGGTPGSLPGRYTSAEGASLVAVIVFAILSILAVGAFLAYVARLSLHTFLAKRRGTGEYVQRSFFQTQLGAYTVSLLLSNFLMSVAFIMNARWVALGRVEADALCTAQGFIRQFSMTASSYFTSAIAIHAFTTLACKTRLPDWLCGAAVVSGWGVAAVMGIIPAMIDNDSLGSLYGFDGMSCGISTSYPALQLFFQVIPVFLAIFTSVLFYGLIYLVIRGTISMSNGIKVNLSSEDRKRSLDLEGADPKYQQFILTVARSMLLYPVAFILLSLADMVIDLLEVMEQQTMSFGLHVVGDSAVAMLGLANAAILFNTLRIVTPVLRRSCENRDPLVTTDSESFFAPSSSPIDPPAKLFLGDHKASLSIESIYKVRTSEDGLLTALPVAHVSPGRRPRVDLSGAMAALKPAVPPKRSSRSQASDKSPFGYSFPRPLSKASAPASPRSSRPISQPPPNRRSTSTTRHKPPPLEEPLRSPLLLPVVNVVGPHAADASEVRIVPSDVERTVVTSPPHCAAVDSISRPASLVDANPPTQSGPTPQLSPAALSAALSSPSASSFSGARSTTSSLLPLLAVPGGRAPNLRASNLRMSVASNGSGPGSRAPSVASSTTSYRGLPRNPRVLRDAWQEVGAQVSARTTPSPLSVNSPGGSALPPVTSGLQFLDKVGVPISGATTPSQSSTSLAHSAPPLRGDASGKLGRPVPRSRSNNDMRGARPSVTFSALPRASSVSVKPSSEDISRRTPSIATFQSPSTVSLVGGGAVPLLVGRRRTTMRSSKSVVVSPSGYI